MVADPVGVDKDPDPIQKKQIPQITDFIDNRVLLYGFL